MFWYLLNSTWTEIYLKTILEVLTSSFQRAKTWEHEFGRVPSISFIFTSSKMDKICKGINYKYFDNLQCQISSMDRGAPCHQWVQRSRPLGGSMLRYIHWMHFIKQEQQFWKRPSSKNITIICKICHVIIRMTRGADRTRNLRLTSDRDDTTPCGTGQLFHK